MHFLVALVASLLAIYLIIRFEHLHIRFSADHDLSSVQKFHHAPVPRIGGAGIFFSMVIYTTYLWLNDSPHLGFFLQFLVPSTIVFGVGILEDLMKNVSVRARLLTTMFAALVGCLLFDATVRSFGLSVIDIIFQITLVALLFTVISVAGVSNAVNLIDGLNGLAGFVCVTSLLATAFVAFMTGDELILAIALASAGAMTGFLIWNYPKGKVFLGDGGAYLAGFVIAELLVLLNERNQEVSVLFPLLLMIYPIFETLFSIYRRAFVRGRSPGRPDALHLHQLINKRIVRWHGRNKDQSFRSRGNARTSPYLWTLNLFAAIPAVLFWNDSWVLSGFIVLFIASYIWIYSRLVRFKVPSLFHYLSGQSRNAIDRTSAGATVR